MANSGRVTTGNLPRLLQLGIDKVIDHFAKDYKGIGEEIFQKIQTEKGFHEMVQLAGMGLATIKGEGAPVQMDSVDQDWVYKWTVVTYAKAARISFEAIRDNLYEDLLPIYGQQCAKALAQTKDILQASVFNSLSSTVGPDASNYASTSHALQAGGTSSNLVSPAVAISEDAIEQMVILADNMKNPDGIVAMVQTKDLVVPTALRFEADRIINSRYRVNSADNTISAIYNQNVIQRVLPWKRLTSNTAFMITTDADNGFIHAMRQGVETDSFKEPTTFDVIVTAFERYVNFLADWRAVIYNNGA